jgi:RNA polymerase sigma-70 factor (ECF subfamily)
LLEAVKARDEVAWRRPVDLYGPLVFHWCRQSGLRQEDRADVFQEVFRTLVEKIDVFCRDRP